MHRQAWDQPRNGTLQDFQHKKCNTGVYTMQGKVEETSSLQLSSSKQKEMHKDKIKQLKK